MLMEGCAEIMAMAEAKWVKFYVRMFDDPKLKIINSKKNRDCIAYVWVRCIMLAGVCNRDGILCINDNIPYSLDTISIEFNRPIEDIKEAMDVLIQLEMIEKTEDGIYAVKNWMKHQNVDGLEKIRKKNAERVAKYRKKKNEEKDKVSDDNIKDIDENKEDESDSNITCNDLESDVTHKREKENKEKDIKNKKRECNSDSSENNTEENDMDLKNLEVQGKELANYFKSMTGSKCSVNSKSLKKAISKHGAEYVKLAMDKTIDMNKTQWSYANGILKNWCNEGYPELDMEDDKNGGKNTGKNSKDDTEKHPDIKKKKPRELTESERRKADEELD